MGIISDETKEELEKREEEYKELLDFAKEKLGEKVHDVRISTRLVSAPVCMSTEGGITLEMERYFKKMPDMGMGIPTAQRILELNADHPAVQTLKAAISEDAEKAEKLVKILHAQALLIAGEELEDPSAYAEAVCSLF